MLKNLIGNYKKRRLEDVKNPTVSSDANIKRLATEGVNSNTASILFHCREGSVTHYYHFFFGALVPLIEFHLANPNKVLRILTDVGPFKLILCELPLTISELRGPNLAMEGRFHDDKSLNQIKQLGEVSLKGYDCFNNEFFHTPHFAKPPRATVQAINKFFRDSLPFYIGELPTYDVILIERAQDVYYQQGGCADRGRIYQTSGSERRSITNHQELVAAVREECTASGRTFCNISLERTSIYYQYHMFSSAKVVIAQHGAALGNIFFMAFGNHDLTHAAASRRGDMSTEVECLPPGVLEASCKSTPTSASGEDGNSISSIAPRPRAAVSVIEISPPWSRQFEHFKNLADYCEVRYSSVLQAEDHSQVAVSAVVALLREGL